MAAAPMATLAEVVKSLEAAGADAIHFDIEDGSFVPMLTLGTRIIKEMRALTSLSFDVHLCMHDPEWLIPDVASMGADWIAVHYEACPYPHRTLRMIRDLNKQAGLAFNPSTPLPDLSYLLPVLDYVVVLATEPEYPNADFLPAVLGKVRLGRTMTNQAPVNWVVDGGITPDNAPLAVEAGATVLVAGRSVFRNGEIAENVSALQAAAYDQPGNGIC
jgi:ribulose-phosphate 3-epimerase